MNKEAVIDYYKKCWLNRFEEGHNPNSLAMHLGYFEEDKTLDNDSAKNKTNQIVVDLMDKHPLDKIRIADLGCGVGGTCFYLAKIFFNADIYGINISKDQVDFANKQRDLKNLKANLSFIEADYTNSTLVKESMDVAIGVESFCHAQNKQLLFNEAYRILKPKGMLIVLDYFETRAAENIKEQGFLEDFRKGWAVKDYIFNEQESLVTAGFSSIKSESIVKNVMPGILNSYNKAIKNKSSVSNSSFSEHLDACIALKELVDSKLIDYKVITAIK